MIVQLSARPEIEAQSQILSHQTFYIKSLWHRSLCGHFGVVVVFYFKSHTYNYLVNGEWALISPKPETRTIILGQREYVKNKKLVRTKKSLVCASLGP